MGEGGRGMDGDVVLCSVTLNMSASTAEPSWGSVNFLLLDACHKLLPPI